MTRPLFLGLTDDRRRPTDEPIAHKRAFTLTEDQRATGMHVIGAPGSGKSKFLEHCIRQDIRAGRPLCLIDPHGALYRAVLEWCCYLGDCLPLPIIPLNLSEARRVIGFNPFDGEGGSSTHTAANRGLATLVKAYGLKNTDDMPTLEFVVRSMFHALIDNGLTIAEAHYLLSAKTEGIRDYLIAHIANDVIRNGWDEQLPKPGTREGRDEFRSTRGKLQRFITSEPMLRFMGLTDGLDLRKIMDEGAVLLVNLQPNPGELDEMDARLFGSMLITKFFSVARTRKRPDRQDPSAFYLYCDEFQNFISPDVVEILPQGRKMGLSMILAHQFLGQLATEDERLVEAVMAAVRTRVVFGLESSDDATKLVSSLFRGLTDFHEVKRIDYSVKFWQEYDRDQVITEGEGETEAEGTQSGRGHTVGAGGGTADMAIDSLMDSASMRHVDQSNWMDADTEFETLSKSYAKSRIRTVADVPIYRQIPFLEGKETPWSLEEQKHRLADVLTMQLQQYCWIKARDVPAKPVVVPMVKRYDLPLDMVDEYEGERAKEAGAITPAEAQQIIDARAKLLEQRGQEFATQRSHPLNSKDDESQQSTTTATKRIRPSPNLKPAARAAKPPQGSDRSEG